MLHENATTNSISCDGHPRQSSKKPSVSRFSEIAIRHSLNPDFGAAAFQRLLNQIGGLWDAESGREICDDLTEIPGKKAHLWLEISVTFA
jgi:hypothetical protein